MYAWVTPADPPGDTICLKVYCPSGAEYEAALRGAILSLTEVENWQNVNGQDVETVAEAFFNVYQQTLLWEYCGMPIGTLIFGAWSVAPDHYLLCDGGSYDTTLYQSLFDVIGYIFGGSGSVFSVPNMARTFPIGAGGGLSVGDTGGSETETLTDNQAPTHFHNIPGLDLLPVQSGAGAFALSLFPTQSYPTDQQGGGQSHNNMPPYGAFNFAIRYE